MYSFNEAYTELRKGLSDYYFWGYLGWNDIRQRYRRSLIGPLWVTLSSAIFITAISIVYGRLFKMEMHQYLPFLTAGYMIWFFISGVVLEGCNTFIEAGSFIRDVNLPLTLFTGRILWRNVLVYMHNFVVVLGVFVFCGVNPGWNSIYFLPGFLLVLINLAWVAIFLAVLGSRFRDVQQIVSSLIQVLFFISPLAWMPKLIGESSLIIKLNPISYFLAVTRDPLLGNIPALSTWAVMIAFAIIGWIVTMAFFSISHKKVVFWL